ncbi:hypothetical protein VNO77_37021 [Canavalia gladiata]|uniref:isoflavone 7-O-methyltransferase n=1 Tax=Canavalia gladiata TaxID=3824 RepID=A0AAN9KA39_CANGL
MESQTEEPAVNLNLLQVQTHTLNHVFSFINSMSLKCAIDLGILETIHKHGQPIPLSLLIVSLSIHPSKTNCIHRLMRILIHSGFVSQQNIKENESEVGYVITDASTLLLKDNPFSMIPLVLSILDPILTTPWYQLPTWLKNDDVNPFKITHGMTLWDYASHEPKFNHLFNDAMACDTRLVAGVVIKKCKEVFNSLESLVDVGGGTGIMAKAIAKAFPQLQCTVFDLPHVVAALQGSENLNYVGGDMFESIPPADAILLKYILHDWNDEECLKILKKCKEAITGKGKNQKVIIIDIVMENEKGDDDESIQAHLFFDMHMMVTVAGKERNEKEWANLIFSAGFCDYKISPVLGMRSLIEIYP